MSKHSAVPSHYPGVWQRTLLRIPASARTARQASVNDTKTQVFWLQAAHCHADLRIPAGRPDFAGVNQLTDCTDEQLDWLTRQQGFAGITQVQKDQCIWHRKVDFQPASGKRDIGHMQFGRDELIETGVEADYMEHWVRLPDSSGPNWVLQLAEEDGQLPAQPAWLLVCGAYFMYVRPRLAQLPPAPDLASLIRATLPNRERLLSWLDFEISFGRRESNTPWQIERSTLPFREGQLAFQPGTLVPAWNKLVVEHGSGRVWRQLDGDML